MTTDQELGDFISGARGLVAMDDAGAALETASRLRTQVDGWQELTDPPFPAASTFDRLLRRRGPIERVASDVGELQIPSYDQVMLPWIRRYGTWEPEESGLLRSLIRPGDHVVDFGAHVGYHSLLAAAAVGPTGRVVSFEPDRRNFTLLCANARQSGVATIRPVPAAAWRTSEVHMFGVSPDNSGDHGFVTAGKRRVPVPALALDDVLPPSFGVNVIKIDIQGVDHHALAGASATIDRHRPTIVVEFWPEGIRSFGDDPVAVAASYRRGGFSLGWCGPEGVEPAPVDDAGLVSLATEHEGGFVSLVLAPTADGA